MKLYLRRAAAASVLLLFGSGLLLTACGDQPAPAPTATPTAEVTATPAPRTPSPTSGSEPAVTPGGTAQVPSALVEEARRLIKLMDEGDFEAAEAEFDPTMKSQLPSDKVREVWQQLTAQFGAFRGTGDAQTGSQDGYSIVVLRAEFERGVLNARVVYDGEARVAGLFFSPAPAGEGTPTATYQAPPYATPGAFTEEEVTVGSGEWALPGTLAMPEGEGPFPGVVLVHGSGPNDRDETIGPNKPFRDFAWGLASRGIAVLRYDKRTHVYAEKMAANAGSITPAEEVVDDARAALELLRGTEGVDPSKVFLLGHSLGGYLAPMIAEAEPRPAGLVVLAGSARPLEDLVLEQCTYIANLDGSVTDDEQEKLEEIAGQVRLVKSRSLMDDTPASSLPLGLPASYWIALRYYDVPQVAAKLDLPVLVLQGERDYQVTMEDFGLWREALQGRDDVELKSYPALNHLFMSGPTGKATPQEYEVTGHVEAEVIEDIATWVKGE